MAEKNILVAFLLNLGFSIYEFIGGTLTGSVAIVSDAVHDLGDAFSIGISYFLERKSHKKADEKYTYGYVRYSVIGGLITTTILVVGSVFVTSQAVQRIFDPVEIHYDAMIVLAVVGVVVNALAAYWTRSGKSLNQRSVNLHMLEDVLGWVVVLVGAIVMRLTNFGLIDPILSILVAGFILKEAVKNCLAIFDVLLEKTPREINLKELQKELCKLRNVDEVHHLHVWTMDGEHNYATLHVVCAPETGEVTKQTVKALLKEKGIAHATVELESPSEKCIEQKCVAAEERVAAHHHAHHH